MVRAEVEEKRLRSCVCLSHERCDGSIVLLVDIDHIVVLFCREIVLLFDCSIAAVEDRTRPET
eukprot:COSAG03_NODE_2881_length_2382_cov_1.042050_3_plen_63_part_00